MESELAKDVPDQLSCVPKRYIHLCRDNASRMEGRQFLRVPGRPGMSIDGLG